MALVVKPGFVIEVTFGSGSDAVDEAGEVGLAIPKDWDWDPVLSTQTPTDWRIFCRAGMQAAHWQIL